MFTLAYIKEINFTTSSRSISDQCAMQYYMATIYTEPLTRVHCIACVTSRVGNAGQTDVNICLEIPYDRILHQYVMHYWHQKSRMVLPDFDSSGPFV